MASNGPSCSALSSDTFSMFDMCEDVTKYVCEQMRVFFYWHLSFLHVFLFRKTSSVSLEGPSPVQKPQANPGFEPPGWTAVHLASC